jgi:hypothetical protein
MKEAFLVQWIHGGGTSGINDVNSYVWDNELGALVDACDSIMDHMDVFMSNQSDKPFVDLIKDFIAEQKYYEAINEFNYFKSTYAPHEEKIFVYVTKAKIHSNNVGVSRAHPLAQSSSNGYFFFSDKSGAKCRKCGDINEYAKPDNINGTYVCYSCKNLCGHR